MTKALYVGSFDPVTNGHIDIIKRSAKIFDTLIVAVGINTSKQGLFTSDERVNFLKQELKTIENVKVLAYTGLTVDLFKKLDVDVLVRGIRNAQDIDIEQQIAGMNRHLDIRVETLWMPTDPQFSYISSSLIKEVIKMGGDVSDLIPKSVYEALKLKL